MNSSGQNTGVNSLSLLQGIFPTQGSNPVPEDMAGTEHRPCLPGTDPIGEAAPGELMAPFSAASEAPQVGRQLSGAALP